MLSLCTNVVPASVVVGQALKPALMSARRLLLSRWPWFAVFTLTVALVAQVQAAIIPVFGTGLDDNGNPLAAGTADPHYTVLETGNAAHVLFDTDPYFPNGPNGQWVWEDANGSPVNVTRTFRTTFDLTGLDHTTAVLHGLWGVDNTGLDILLNGTSIGTSLPSHEDTKNFTQLHPIFMSSGFQATTNTLDFVIQDVGLVAAFRAELFGTANAVDGTVPEPTGLAIWGTLGGLCLIAARRRREQVA